MRFFNYLLIALLLGFSHFIYADEPVPVQGKLDNGLRWIILPLSEQKDRTDVIIRVYAGGLDETEQQSGGAHMVEHMVFRSTDAHPEGVMPYLLNSGWLRGRNYNAYTTHDHTTYLYFPPKEFGLEKTLAVAAQMLFHAHITRQDLDDERKIVLEEWRMRDGFRRRLWEQRINSNRYASRYANRPVIGSEQSIKDMPPEQLKQYYRDWYVPNNMQILLVGDITPEQGGKLIRQYFGKQPSRPLPPRDDNYYEPELQNRLRVDRLSDPQNNQSQATYLWRFDDSKSQAQTDEGRREGLIDDLALRLVNQRFRSEKTQLPGEIASLTAKKHLIGKRTGMFQLTANIEKQAHHRTVQFLMRQAERLKRFPFLAEELERQKEKMLEQLKNEQKAVLNYSFEDWTQTMISSLLNDKNYYSQSETEQFIQEMLPNITIDEVNARIQSWLTSEDQAVQYMPPLTVEVADITEAMASDWREQAKRTEFSPPPDTAKKRLAFPPLAQKGKIVKEQRFDEQNLVHWTLSNGDNVFWLKSPIAGSKTYFIAQSEAGSHGKGLNDWQAKFALQLIGQNAPNDWTFEQLREWKETYGIPLVMRMPFNRLHLISTVENTKLNDLLRYYRANQQEIRIKEDFDKAKREFVRSIDIRDNSSDARRALAWENFVYGRPLNSRPEIAQVENITVTELEEQWHKIRQAPVTFFLMNNLDQATVEAAVTNNLSAIPRAEPLPASVPLVSAGSAEEVYPFNPEPRDNIYLSFYREHTWSVREEIKTNLLGIMTLQKILHYLRDKNLGVYGARTSVKLTKESGRLHTVITFAADPKLSRRLINIAETTLLDLPRLFTREDFERVQKHLKQQEEQSLNTPDGLLTRLIYAITYAQDPAYLSNADELFASITFEEIQELATKLHSARNRRLFVTTTKDKVSDKDQSKEK